MVVLHITTEEAWELAKKSGEYTAPSLETEGFIHMSTKEQTQGTLNLWFKDATNLLLLHIDPTQLKSKLVFEAPIGNPKAGEFPHLYGPLCLDAVTHTQSISRPNTNTPWVVQIDE